jgi:hypothetical protein
MKYLIVLVTCTIDRLNKKIIVSIVPFLLNLSPSYFILKQKTKYSNDEKICKSKRNAVNTTVSTYLLFYKVKLCLKVYYYDSVYTKLQDFKIL